MTVFEEGKDVKLVFEFNDKWTDLLKFDDAEEVRRRAHTIITNILKQKLSQQTPNIIVTNSRINSLAPDLLVRIEK